MRHTRSRTGTNTPGGSRRPPWSECARRPGRLLRWSRCSNLRFRGPFLPSAVAAVLFLTLAALPLAALDLTLNGRNHAVMDPDALGAFARPLPGGSGAVGLPLSALYPWLEDVEYLEVQSGPNRVYWDETRLGAGGWENAAMVRRGGVWEVRVGRDVFSLPDRIAVRGDVIPVENLRIASAVNLPEFEADLRGALALRGYRLEWASTDDPELLLISSASRPHLVILDQMDAVVLSDLLTSSRPVAARRSAWYAMAFAGDESALSATAPSVETGPITAPVPLAADIYHPEAALEWLLADDEPLFAADAPGLASPESLEAFLAGAAAARRSGALIVTDEPLAELTGGLALSALRLPSSDETITGPDGDYILIDPPTGTAGLARPVIMAVPANLPSSDARISALLAKDADRFAEAAPEVSIPADPRTRLFYEAYERIGRLAISGQMDPGEAADLIDSYIADNAPGDE